MNAFELNNIVAEAKREAYDAAEATEKKYFQDRFDCCGFAWVNIYSYNGKKLDGRSKIAKELKKFGIDKSYSGGFQLWNPSGYPTQNLTTLEEGARAAAKVLTKYGFEAYAGSRMD